MKKQFDFILPSIDPSPEMESNLLKSSAQAPTILEKTNKTLNIFKSILSHFENLSKDYEALSNIDGIEIPETIPIHKMTKLILQSFQNISHSIKTMCIEPLEQFNKEIVAPISQFRDEYIHANNEFSKALEPYGAINQRTKVEQISQLEKDLTTSMASRAGAYYVLSRCVENLQNKSNKTFLGTLFEANSTIFHALSPMVTELPPAKIIDIQNSTDCFAPAISSVPRNNMCVNIAQQYIDTRFNNASAPGSLLKPCGIVWLRSHSLRTIWTRKYLTFSDGVLTAYDLQGGKEHTWDLALVTTQPVKKKKRRYCFKLQSDREDIQLQALTKLDMEEWLSIFTNHNGQLLGEVACDEICGDCGAKNATWISLNWGVSLCLKCSGVHRQMGANNSKVRSPSLDHLHPWILALHQVLGNDYANKILLNKDTGMDIKPRMDDSVRAIFIKRKYIMKDWATQSPVPNPFDAIKQNNLEMLFHSLNFSQPGIVDSNGCSPIHAAAQLNNPNLLALTLVCTNDTSIDINSLDSEGWSPLAISVFLDNPDEVSFLINQGARVTDQNLFLIAVARGNENVIKIIGQNLQEIAVPRSTGKIFNGKFEYVPEEKRGNIQPIEVDDDLIQKALDASQQFHK